MKAYRCQKCGREMVLRQLMPPPGISGPVDGDLYCPHCEPRTDDKIRPGRCLLVILIVVVMLVLVVWGKAIVMWTVNLFR